MKLESKRIQLAIVLVILIPLIMGFSGFLTGGWLKAVDLWLNGVIATVIVIIATLIVIIFSKIKNAKPA